MDTKKLEIEARLFLFENGKETEEKKKELFKEILSEIKTFKFKRVLELHKMVEVVKPYNLRNEFQRMYENKLKTTIKNISFENTPKEIPSWFLEGLSKPAQIIPSLQEVWCDKVREFLEKT